MPLKVLIRGGGDLASGVALRLHRAGISLLIAELPQPLVVRRLVSFAEAVYAGETRVEEVTARLAGDLAEAEALMEAGVIPVLVDPQATLLPQLGPQVLVDARMTKRPPELGLEAAPLVIGLGPGFTAGENCHAVIETMRGHTLGRVIWQGSAIANTGIPGSIHRQKVDRVLRAPADGELIAHAHIGDLLKAGQAVAEVAGQELRAPFDGVLRGLLHPGLQVEKGFKIGDLDPRNEPSYCTLVSDKSLAIGGGVLEAILARPDLRAHLWD